MSWNILKGGITFTLPCIYMYGGDVSSFLKMYGTMTTYLRYTVIYMHWSCNSMTLFPLCLNIPITCAYHNLWSMTYRHAHHVAQIPASINNTSTWYVVYMLRVSYYM